MKLKPSASIETNAGIPISWAFLGTLPHFCMCLKTAQLIENKKALMDH